MDLHTFQVFLIHVLESYISSMQFEDKQLHVKDQLHTQSNIIAAPQPSF